jgi:hypothetical protein
MFSHTFPAAAPLTPTGTSAMPLVVPSPPQSHYTDHLAHSTRDWPRCAHAVESIIRAPATPDLETALGVFDFYMTSVFYMSWCEKDEQYRRRSEYENYSHFVAYAAKSPSKKRGFGSRRRTVSFARFWVTDQYFSRSLIP